MSGGGNIEVPTTEDTLTQQKLIENNESLKELIIQLTKVIEYLQAITGDKL